MLTLIVNILCDVTCRKTFQTFQKGNGLVRSRNIDISPESTYFIVFFGSFIWVHTTVSEFGNCCSSVYHRGYLVAVCNDGYVIIDLVFIESLANHIMDDDVMSHSQKLRHKETVFVDSRAYYCMNNSLMTLVFNPRMSREHC